ncbi:TPA: hypothetical protein ACH1VU_005577 [Pseudomonas aeruginosa]
MTNAAAATIEALVITTLAGLELHLKPVPMAIQPSESSENWLKFQGAHIAGGGLDEAVQNKVQAFMRRHKTEALFDGGRYLTLAGSGLAICYPDMFHVEGEGVTGTSENVSSETPMSHVIKLDGEFLIKGDEVSIRMFWFNLNGRNFSDRRQPFNPDLTYENYLQMVEHDWKCDLKSGGVLTLHQVGSAEVLETHTIQR